MRWILPLVGLCIAVAGCSSGQPGRVVQPAMDPDAIVEGIMEACDQNADGALAKAELEMIPGIGFVRGGLDKDGDRSVSGEELRDWLIGIKESRVAVTSAMVELRHRRRPLQGATVRLVPEPVMGGTIKEATGTTDEAGLASLEITEGRRLPGVNCGLYRVEVTGAGNDGKPLPAEFNTATRLGIAVGGGLNESGTIVLNLD